MEQKHRNLNSSSNDDAHEKIGDNTGYGHHQTLNHCDTCIKAKHKEKIMFEAWMEADHEITNSSRDESDHYQERHCRNGVANDKCNHTIVAIQPLPLKDLQNMGFRIKSTISLADFMRQTLKY